MKTKGGNKTSAIVDNILQVVVGAGILTAVVTAPNIMIALDKPIKKYYKNLDQRERNRETQKILRYMKSTGLIKGSYDHGLRISKKGKKRISKQLLMNIKIKPQENWDKKWRLVLYDIPEKYKSNRNKITMMMKRLGFCQFQKSVWVFPYPCRHEIEIISTEQKVSKYITYIETSFIDNQEKLISKFQKILRTNI